MRLVFITFLQGEFNSKSIFGTTENVSLKIEIMFCGKLYWEDSF